VKSSLMPPKLERPKLNTTVKPSGMMNTPSSHSAGSAANR